MVESILKKINEYEEKASVLLIQILDLKEQVMEAYNMDKMGNENISNFENIETSKVPFVAYEMQLERHLEEKKDLLDRHEVEKDKMRKYYKSIILSISIALTALIIGVFAAIIYIVSNYNFEIDTLSFTQDIDADDNGTAVIEDGIEYNNTTQK